MRVVSNNFHDVGNNARAYVGTRVRPRLKIWVWKAVRQTCIRKPLHAISLLMQLY